MMILTSIKIKTTPCCQRGVLEYLIAKDIIYQLTVFNLLMHFYFSNVKRQGFFDICAFSAIV